MPAFLFSAARDGAIQRVATTGAGAMRDVDRVATGLRLNKVHPDFVCMIGLTATPFALPGEIPPRCEETRATVAANIAAGIY